MQKIKLAYFGSPRSAAEFLEKMVLDKDLPVEIKLVVTQPDKKAGRKQILTPTPVKIMAQKYNIPFIDNIKTMVGEQQNPLPIQTIDLALLIFYGKIIPPDILSLPKHGFWNIHFSDLPKYRGGFPFVYSLIMGDIDLRVTLFKMDNKLDHGPIIDQTEVMISEKERAPELEQKCSAIGYELFKKNIKHLMNNPAFVTTTALKQDESKATYTQLLNRRHGFILLQTLQKALRNEPLNLADCPIIIEEYCQQNHLSLKQCDSKTIFNLFRGLYPWPGIWTLLPSGKRLKITDIDYVNDRLLVKKVQLEGKIEVEFTTFNNSYKIF